MIDFVIWWTGTIVWVAALGALIGFLLTLIYVALKTAVFTSRVCSKNVHRNGILASLKFWWWAFKTLPDAIDVETGDDQWTTIYFPGIEPLEQHDD